MKKKTGVKKANICHKCGEPPTNGILTKHKGEWKCGECLLNPTESAKIEAAYDDMTRVGYMTCPLGDDSALPSEAYYTCEEKKIVTANMEKHKIKSYSYRDGNNGLYK